MRYRWNGTDFIDPDGNPMVDRSAPYVPAMPLVISDLEPYESPASGKIITSKSEQREDLAATGCRLLDPSESPTKGRVRNAKFAAKRGLTVSDEFRKSDAEMKRET